MRYKNSLDVYDGVAVIETSRGDLILIDAADAETCGKHSWRKHSDGYAVAKINSKTVRLHRFLMGSISAGMEIDHINGNPLDNRRRNLRIATRAQNAMNFGPMHSELGVTGVRRNRKRFMARIGISGKSVCLGTFDTVEQARAARINAEMNLYGEYAPSACRRGGLANE